MNSSVIGKIEKARRYAQERDRIRVNALSVHFHGENGDHAVELANEKWRCTCDFFAGYGACVVVGWSSPSFARTSGLPVAAGGCS